MNDIQSNTNRRQKFILLYEAADHSKTISNPANNFNLIKIKNNLRLIKVKKQILEKTKLNFIIIFETYVFLDNENILCFIHYKNTGYAKKNNIFYFLPSIFPFCFFTSYCITFFRFFL